MDAPDKLQQFVSALPPELKISIIYWMVKINQPIMSTALSASLAPQVQTPNMPTPPLYDGQNMWRTPHPLWLFPAGSALEAIATEEFWKANVFEFQSTVPQTRGDRNAERNGLWDDISRRPFIRHLNVDTRGEHYCTAKTPKEELGVIDIVVIEQLSSVYPRLETLELKIAHGMTPGHSLVWRNRLLHLFTNIVRAVAQLDGVRQKVVHCEHSEHKRGCLPLCRPIEMDGRRRELEDLVREMLQCHEVFVRLA